MKLPRLAYSDGITKSTQVKFNGLNHNLGAGDGELWDMRNLTSDYQPLLATRAPRMLYRTLTEPGGLFSWDGLAWADGDGFYYRGERAGTVMPGKKTFAALGAYIVILPDKAYYNTESGEFGTLERSWSGTSLTFTNGLLFEEAAEANTIQAAGVDWEAQGFKAGDAVTIEGCTKHPENNKTPVIREIDGDKLYFYEYIFTLDGEEGTTPYTETGELTVKRTVPDMLFLCENENRLWGCDENTIYASKLGDIFNWNVYEGLETDSYAVDTGSAGKFTACVSYLGYPIFFKEEHIYKVYGSLPSNFEVMGSATLGVAEGSADSLAVAGETLFYLSRAGIMAYSGGIPQPVSQAFGMERHELAAGGSDGLKYYVSMKDSEGWKLDVYDVRRGMWHTEDETHATHFARWEGNTYFLTEEGEIWITGNTQNPPEEAEPEKSVPWEAEFGDFVEDSPDKKGISKVQIRLELEEGASATVWMLFDTTGEWLKVAELPANVYHKGISSASGGEASGPHLKRSYYLPIVPRRADHYRLKLEGTGTCRVHSIAREYYRGSELRSQPGRN